MLSRQLRSTLSDIESLFLALEAHAFFPLAFVIAKNYDWLCCFQSLSLSEMAQKQKKVVRSSPPGSVSQHNRTSWIQLTINKQGMVGRKL
jgi:hypothetical protein